MVGPVTPVKMTAPGGCLNTWSSQSPEATAAQGFGGQAHRAGAANPDSGARAPAPPGPRSKGLHSTRPKEFPIIRVLWWFKSCHQLPRAPGSCETGSVCSEAAAVCPLGGPTSCELCSCSLTKNAREGRRSGLCHVSSRSPRERRCLWPAVWTCFWGPQRPGAAPAHSQCSLARVGTAPGDSAQGSARGLR